MRIPILRRIPERAFTTTWLASRLGCFVALLIALATVTPSGPVLSCSRPNTRTLSTTVALRQSLGLIGVPSGGTTTRATPVCTKSIMLPVLIAAPVPNCRRSLLISSSPGSLGSLRRRPRQSPEPLSLTWYEPPNVVLSGSCRFVPATRGPPF